MSRKRKITVQDFDLKNSHDLDDKKLCEEKGINHLRHGVVTDLDIFPSGENIVSNSSVFITNKADIVHNVSGFNSNNNDSLFVNSDSCNYEYVLTETDILNSVSANENFYNDCITLYNSNSDNGNLFDNSLVHEYCENLEATVTNPHSNNDIIINGTDTKIVSGTENLENVVPNLCFNTKLSTDINHNSFLNESGIVEKHCSQNKTDSTDSLVSNKIEIGGCLDNIAVDNTLQEKGLVNKFVCFQEPQINNECNTKINVDNIDTNQKLINSLNIFGLGNSCKNLKIIPIQYLKNNKVPIDKSCQKVTTNLLKTPSKISALAKTLNVRNVVSLKMNSKQPQVSNKSIKNVIACIKNKNVPLVKFEDFLRNQNMKTSAKPINKSQVLKLTMENLVHNATDKCVQTDNNGLFYNNLCEISESENIKKIQVTNTMTDELVLDRIKKPELFQELLLFSFGVNLKSSFCNVLNQENFINNNDKINYYTGIPQYSYFMALLNMLDLPNNKMLSPFHMLLLTLMKIKLNLDWIDLAYRFNQNIQIAKDTFGITVYILNKCLSKLVYWPQGEMKDNNIFRTGRNVYIYCLKLKSKEIGCYKKIFICLSNSGYPIHFVSKTISETCLDRLEILHRSGIMNGLVPNDTIIFDKNTNYSSYNEEWSTVLSVSSKSRDSFYAHPFSERLEDVEKMKKTVSKIETFKFLFDNVSCEWANVHLGHEYWLFTDVVNLVCGLINLCNVLPYSNNSVRKIISERKNMKLKLT